MVWPFRESREEKNQQTTAAFLHTNTCTHTHTHSNCTHTNAFAPQCPKPRQTEIWIKRWLNTKKNIVLHYKFSLIHEPVNWALFSGADSPVFVCARVRGRRCDRTHSLAHKYPSMHSLIWFDESNSNCTSHHFDTFQMRLLQCDDHFILILSSKWTCSWIDKAQKWWMQRVWSTAMRSWNVHYDYLMMISNETQY